MPLAVDWGVRRRPQRVGTGSFSLCTTSSPVLHLDTPAWQHLRPMTFDPPRQGAAGSEADWGLGKQTEEGVTGPIKSGAGGESTSGPLPCPSAQVGPPLARGLVGEWPLPAPARHLGSQVLRCPLGPSFLWCVRQLCWHPQPRQLPSNGGHTGTGGPERPALHTCELTAILSLSVAAPGAAGGQVGRRHLPPPSRVRQ